jgi:hypothetical protein
MLSCMPRPYAVVLSQCRCTIDSSENEITMHGRIKLGPVLGSGYCAWAGHPRIRLHGGRHTVRGPGQSPGRGCRAHGSALPRGTGARSPRRALWGREHRWIRGCRRHESRISGNDIVAPGPGAGHPAKIRARRRPSRVQRESRIFFGRGRWCRMNVGAGRARLALPRIGMRRRAHTMRPYGDGNR